MWATSEDAGRIDEILGHGCLNVFYVPVRDKSFLFYSATCIFMSKLPFYENVWCMLWTNTNLSEAHWVASECHPLLDISAQRRGLGCLARSVPRNALLSTGETWSWTVSQTGWGHCKDQLLLRFLPRSSGSMYKTSQRHPMDWTGKALQGPCSFQCTCSLAWLTDWQHFLLGMGS